MVSIQTKFTGDMEASLTLFGKTVANEVIFSGAAAMAKTLYEEVRLRCPVSAKAHWFYGTHKKYFFPAGTLKAAIYRVYSPERSGELKKTYRISWNHQKAPYGFMVEFGTSRAPAHPFLRPAFDQIQQAIHAGQARMAQRLKEG